MVAQVQKQAPHFKKTAVVDGVFEEVSLDQYRGKYVVLAFIPLAFTFVCPTEIVAFSDSVKKFKDLGAEVLFASTDSEYSLLAWTNVARKDGGLGQVSIPLVSDNNHSLSRDYGVLLEEEGVALRGLFVIDPAGVVRHITINDLPVGRNVEEALRIVEAFQWTDKHGTVLPCNWTPGAATIKPDVKDSKEYFSKVNK
ncbi:TSA2 (YDR453C) and TSA1 (YML028W) [Zygosaccharomyces parabailii]|uniref:thioredoxin-dependent peroxiredoxin n=1 Tax=Zygosaccharomyces bailii (strain CLIB 213 / ATCC 58445 / CBS 680 / BCRC 21525 / NBRC 1098 / NCYC 1416 / NRRL Y-2227) TaxID=1333698 RepID=A0A8J2X887_ZYGB2|nr:TSA2 (YDR453C) and TSA1 (YML028W) [Zygosaccharomyces parabailii]CDF89833.1 ZYBA0S05-02806g1_1 [Zygosaccharomyces bailii CLIB 213]CDH11910.1 Peroxiredoxin TSA1 [Zygosaccharomyces bailii ISA1307]SJM87100.1 Peroxiredoxin TSA1 [Zygosaccharomyces bailii]AQZ16776.1 TSA2 (YDR453C) and TSA1 (YML028W) [Zygosaccharomyces parabailii]